MVEHGTYVVNHALWRYMIRSYDVVHHGSGSELEPFFRRIPW
jgi:hypothetical protein